jgi:hypothetical protein
MSSISSKNKRRRAATLDELGGIASSRVHFLRTDARAAAAAPTTSRTKLKEALSSELEPQWTAATGEAAASVLRQLGQECSGDAARAGMLLGRGAVGRALRRRQLRAVVLAREAGVPLLYSHLAKLAQDAGAPVCLLACGSAQLGQPFGLLRASAVGLRADHFNEHHELVLLLRRAAGSGGAQPLPWASAPGAAVEGSRTDAPGAASPGSSRQV